MTGRALLRPIVTPHDDPPLMRYEPDRVTALVAAHTDELLAREKSSRRFAWGAAGVLALVCGAQAAAIVALLPLKQTSTYAVVVDGATGVAESGRAIDVSTLTPAQGAKQAFLTQYVVARESFDTGDAAVRDGLLKTWSSPAELAAYRASAATTPKEIKRRVTVRAVGVTPTAPLRAVVDFDVRERAPDGYDVNMSFRARIELKAARTPAGFVVASYRKDDAPIAVAQSGEDAGVVDAPARRLAVPSVITIPPPTEDGDAPAPTRSAPPQEPQP